MALRYNFFVKGKLQSSIILNILMIFLMIVTIAAIDFYVIQHTLVNSIPDSEMKQNFIENATTVLGTGDFQMKVGILILINLFVVFVVTLLYSHRIAGPTYKIEKTLKEIQETKNFGKKLVLRKGDQIYEVGDSINEFLEFINNEFKGFKDEIEVFEKRHEALAKCSDSDITQESINGLVESILRLKNHVSQIDTEEKNSENPERDGLKI